MEQEVRRAANGPDPGTPRSVNGHMRQAAANLALIINECGLSQSELSRRSGVSRQLINGWARQRVSVTLSSTVGQLLSGIELTLADLLLDQEALCVKIGKALPSAPDGPQILPNLTRLSREAPSQRRLESILGTFRYKTRLKDNPMFVLERLFQFEAHDDDGTTVKLFEDVCASNKTFAEGHCFHHQSMFLVTVECSEPPHQPLIFAFRDPLTPKIQALNGVSIAPDLFGPFAGCPLARLVYLYRANSDGTVVSGEGFNPDAEFNALIPPDICSVITTY
jgi:transcriptional regulator with XRE-family HTH domain